MKISILFIFMRNTLDENESSCRLLFQRLNERDKRHVAGLLALSLGRGGVTFAAHLSGLDNDTVAKGKKELLNNFRDVPSNRIRKPGAGRPSLEKKIPNRSNDLKNSLNKKPEDRRQENVNSFD